MFSLSAVLCTVYHKCFTSITSMALPSLCRSRQVLCSRQLADLKILTNPHETHVSAKSYTLSNAGARCDRIQIQVIYSNIGGNVVINLLQRCKHETRVRLQNHISPTRKSESKRFGSHGLGVTKNFLDNCNPKINFTGCC